MSEPVPLRQAIAELIEDNGWGERLAALDLGIRTGERPGPVRFEDTIPQEDW